MNFQLIEIVALFYWIRNIILEDEIIPLTFLVGAFPYNYGFLRNVEESFEILNRQMSKKC